MQGSEVSAVAGGKQGHPVRTHTGVFGALANNTGSYLLAGSHPKGKLEKTQDAVVMGLFTAALFVTARSEAPWMSSSSGLVEQSDAPMGWCATRGAEGTGALWAWLVGSGWRCVLGGEGADHVCGVPSLLGRSVGWLESTSRRMDTQTDTPFLSTREFPYIPNKAKCQ